MDTTSEINVGTKKASEESVYPLSTYQIKPPLQERFKSEPIKEIIHYVLIQNLSGRAYEENNVKKWTVNIANQINEKVKELQMKRYKHVVQVTIGEMRDGGVKSGVRCLWDPDTDGYSSDTFISETIFAVVAVFAVYLY